MTFSRSCADDFVAAEWTKYDYPFVKRLLLHYAGLYGNMRVPKVFVVPATTAWPYDMHGVDLGKVGLGHTRAVFGILVTFLLCVCVWLTSLLPCRPFDAPHPPPAAP